jgi:hypothetical protein
VRGGLGSAVSQVMAQEPRLPVRVPAVPAFGPTGSLDDPLQGAAIAVDPIVTAPARRAPGA